MKLQKYNPILAFLLISGLATVFISGCGSSSNTSIESRIMWDVWFDSDNGMETQQYTPIVLDLNNNKKADITGANILGDGHVTDGILFDMDPENIAFEFKCELAENKCPESTDGYWVDLGGERIDNALPEGIRKDSVGYQYLDESGNFVGLIKEDGLLHYGEQEERELTEWLAPGGGDGLLVWDFDEDGQITTAKELFGTVGLDGEQFANGFEKLAHYFDENKDGQVDGNELDGLQVWVDENGDGIVDEGELQSLADHGIISFDVSNYDKDTMQGSYQVEVLN